MDTESKRYAIGASILSFLVGLVLLAYVPDVDVNHPRWATIMKLTGSFLTISVIVSLLYSIFIKPSDDAVRKKELRDLFNEKIDEITIGKGKYGLFGFVDSINFADLFDELKPNQILWWLDTYPLGLGIWTNNLKRALENGVRIKMLVLDPNSQNVTHRANELGSEFTPDGFKNDISRFLNHLKIIDQNGFKGKLEVRTYDELIGLPLYIITENNKPILGYSGFFLNKPTAVESPHLKWGFGEHSILYSMAAYISEKWDRNQNNIVV